MQTETRLTMSRTSGDAGRQRQGGSGGGGQRRRQNGGAGVRFPHWASVLGMLEIADRVAGIWGETVGAPAPQPQPQTPPEFIPAPTFRLSGLTNPHIPGLQAAPSARPAAPLHPLDLLAATRRVAVGF